MQERTTTAYDRRYRRFFRRAFSASVLIHLLVLLAFRERLAIPPSPFAAAGPRAGDDRAAAGGGTQVVALRITPPQVEPTPVVVPEVPKPVPEVEEVVIEEPKPQVVAAATVPVEGIAMVGQGKGTASGEGIETGTGRGDGGTDEEGRFRVIPPSPRGLILPPSERPRQVRGREIDVWVFVTQTGRVLDDSTRLAPSTGDRKFDERLRKQAAEWVFEPARRDGRAVPEWFRYTIIL